MYTPRVGDSIQFANSPLNSHIVYRVDSVCDHRVVVSTDYPVTDYRMTYDMGIGIFEELSPFPAMLTQDEIDILSVVYRGSLVDMLDLLDVMTIMALDYGEAFAAVILPIEQIEAMDAMMEEFQKAISDLHNFGTFVPDADAATIAADEPLADWERELLGH